ncbi:MAG: hypothetical protein AAB263_01725 [Planctomycetota bacterium]
MHLLRSLAHICKRVGSGIAAITVAIAELLHAILGRLVDAHYPAKQAGDFHDIQELINHVGHPDGDTRRALSQHLNRMLPADKDRLVEILVMTLRVEAKKTLVRKRAIALLAFRLNAVGERLYRIGF